MIVSVCPKCNIAIPPPIQDILGKGKELICRNCGTEFKINKDKIEIIEVKKTGKICLDECHFFKLGRCTNKEAIIKEKKTKKDQYNNDIEFDKEINMYGKTIEQLPKNGCEMMLLLLKDKENKI